EKEVGCITKAEILTFRSSLAKVTNRSGKTLSATRINHIMTPLRMILNEAANRYNFSSPYVGIKSLKVPRVDVEPVTLEEVGRIIAAVRSDFKNYYTARSFTGMPPSATHGVQWQYVAAGARDNLVREAVLHDK